ncbi:hypothetical protein HDK64DRAFT_251505 [Phyllosticta capitalensis]
MPDTAVMTMPFNDDPFRERMRHVHFDAITPLGTEYTKTPLFAMAAGRDFGAASSWPFGKAVIGLQERADPCQPPATALRTPPIKKEPLKELEKLGMVANCKKPYSPEEDLNDRLRRAAAFLAEQKQGDLLDIEGRLVEIEELLGNAAQEEQVDHRLVDRVRAMVAMTREGMAGENRMQLDQGSAQDREEQGADEKVEFSLPIRINVGELRSASRETTAGESSKRGSAPGGRRGGGNSAGGSGGVAPNNFAGGSGGAGGGNGSDDNWNRPPPDSLHRADGDGQEEEDGEGDEEPKTEWADRNPPWNEKWYPSERATYPAGETIFAQNHASAKMATELFRSTSVSFALDFEMLTPPSDDEGKRPKMPEAKTLPYKSQFKLPDVQQQMLGNDGWLHREGTWNLDHMAGEDDDLEKSLADNFPLHEDCE